MQFRFYPDAIADAGEAETISGQAQSFYGDRAYLLVEEEEQRRLFRICYDSPGGAPFKEAAIQNGLLGVGIGHHFYLYDLTAKQNLLVLPMSEYFCALYTDGDLFFVADAESLFCIGADGTVLWHSRNLGIDGVIIDAFTADEIQGSGEWDPPGGWKGFVLDKATGNRLDVRRSKAGG